MLAFCNARILAQPNGRVAADLTHGNAFATGYCRRLVKGEH